jgi:hypothetical protein
MCPLVPPPFQGTKLQQPSSRTSLSQPATTSPHKMQLTTAMILAFAASAMALVVPRQASEEAQPPLPCKNFKQPRFEEYIYGCCSPGAVDCVHGECTLRQGLQNAASSCVGSYTY